MDYYKLFNLNRSATEAEIKSAYRKLAKAYHPDKNLGKEEEAERTFKIVSNAYNILKDPEKRMIYDEYGEEGLRNDWSPPRRQNHSYYGSFSSSSSSYPSHQSSASTSSSRQSYGKKPSSSASTSSSPQSYGNAFSSRRSNTHSVSEFSNDYFGGKGQYEYRRTPTGVPFGEPVKKANGYQRTSSGMPFCEPMKKKDAPVERILHLTLEEIYNGANKRMKIIRTIIENRIRKTKEEIVTIKIKPGCEVGTKFTFSEMGDEKPDIIAADIIFVIAEKPHALYTKNGNDLLIVQKIRIVDVLTGLKIPTLDGRTLLVTLPSKVNPGYEHKVPGEGMPIAKEPRRKGTLKITITKVKYPTSLTPQQKSGLRRVLG